MNNNQTTSTSLHPTVVALTTRRRDDVVASAQARNAYSRRKIEQLVRDAAFVASSGFSIRSRARGSHIVTTALNLDRSLPLWRMTAIETMASDHQADLGHRYFTPLPILHFPFDITCNTSAHASSMTEILRHHTVLAVSATDEFKYLSSQSDALSAIYYLTLIGRSPEEIAASTYCNRITTPLVLSLLSRALTSELVYQHYLLN